MELFAKPKITDAQRLAVEAYLLIKKFPGNWDQSSWRAPVKNRCGAKLCFYGTVADLAGGEWLTPATEPSGASLLVPEFDDDPSQVHNTLWLNEGVYGPGIEVWNRVNRLLGISDSTGSLLYAGENTLADIRRGIKTVLNVDPEDFVFAICVR